MSPVPTVLVERDGPVAWVTLNRPEQLNAFSAAMRRDLAQAFTLLQADEALRAVVLTGAGRAFCAGGDLAEFQSLLAAGKEEALCAGVAEASELFTRIEQFPRPVIAAVNGVCVAGGLELVLCCDLVIASAEARMGDGHLKYAVLPGGGGTARLVRKLPRNLAKQLLFTGELVPASRLQAWGLVNELVAPSELRARAGALARQLAAASPLALAAVKRLANGAADQFQQESLQQEQQAFGAYATSHDFREGMASFANKRAPLYQGR